MNEALDCEAVVTDYETITCNERVFGRGGRERSLHDRLEAESDDSAEFLRGKLE